MDELEAAVEGFKGGATVTGWRLEEVDIRKNEINKVGLSCKNYDANLYNSFFLLS